MEEEENPDKGLEQATKLLEGVKELQGSDFVKASEERAKRQTELLSDIKELLKDIKSILSNK